MEKLQKTKGLEDVPRPCEHFDLIGGTSTGGYSVIHTLLCLAELADTDTESLP